MTENLPAVKQSLSPDLPSPHEMAVYTTMAKQAVESRMYRGMGEQSGVMMIMLAARELGIPPMQALNGGIHIIEGKVEISARMMGAMIWRAGHQFTIKESTDDKCVLIGTRSGGASATVSYTIEDAQRAGLVKEKGAWRKCPKDMCFARALSRLARQLFSDVIGIGYVEGEIKSVEELPSHIEADKIGEMGSEPSVDELYDLRRQYLELFAATDVQLATEFFNSVKEHFRWPEGQTFINLLADKEKLKAKFEVWKIKNNKVPVGVVEVQTS